MYDKHVPAMVERGNRVITVDLLGHGGSDRPDDMRIYTMTSFARQLAAVIEHLELVSPVVGGTSLGANITLDLAVNHRNSAGALFFEMPVLEDALLGAVLIFTPILIGLRFGYPALSVVSKVTRRVPRTTFLADILLDWMRREPASSRAVLEGVFFGGAAPPQEKRKRIRHPALVIGHPADPLHPFSDADMLASELANARLVNANSALEWRVSPERLDGELARFLDDFYAEAPETGELRAAERP
jgi:pimeloyl-ACP methyl ester carboxylesterase